MCTSINVPTLVHTSAHPTPPDNPPDTPLDTTRHHPTPPSDVTGAMAKEFIEGDLDATQAPTTQAAAEDDESDEDMDGL